MQYYTRVQIILLFWSSVCLCNGTKTPDAKGWLGHYNKDTVIGTSRYQTPGRLSEVRVRAALLAPSISSRYTLTQEGKNTGLKGAAEHNNIRTTQVLLNHGAEPQQALTTAVVHGSDKVVQELINRGAHVEEEHIQAVGQCYSRHFLQENKDIADTKEKLDGCRRAGVALQAFLYARREDARKTKEQQEQEKQRLEKEKAKIEQQIQKAHIEVCKASNQEYSNAIKAQRLGFINTIENKLHAFFTTLPQQPESVVSLSPKSESKNIQTQRFFTQESLYRIFDLSSGN